MRMKNRYFEAAKEDYNIIALSGVTAISLLTLSFVPVLFAGILEIVYLLVVGNLKWYNNLLNQRSFAESEEKRIANRKKLLSNLPSNITQRYHKLESVRNQIRKSAADTDDEWTKSILVKLDYLLDKFLQFAVKESTFRKYLWDVQKAASGTTGYNPLPSDTNWVTKAVKTSQQSYDKEIKALTDKAGTEDDEHSRAVLEKRKSVLERRRGFVERMADIRGNLSYQMELLEDTSGLISEEIMARPSEQILSEIEDVVVQTNTMSELLNEMAPLEQIMSKPLMSA